MCTGSDLGELSSRCGGNLTPIDIQTSATPLKSAPKQLSFLAMAGVETASIFQSYLQWPKGRSHLSLAVIRS